MASAYNLRRIVAILLLLLFALAGCPNPNMHLWFGEEAKKGDIVFRLADGAIRLELDSHSWRPCGDYQANLHILVKCKNGSNDVSLKPEAIQVKVQDSTMRFSTEGEGEYSVDTLENELRAHMYYQTWVDPQTVPVKGKMPVTIVFNDFLSYRGEVLHIDTVTAWEKQGCWY